MFAPSADMVLPRLRTGFQVKKTMITVFFAETRLIVLNSLPQGVQEVIESWPAVCIIIPYVLIGCPIMSV
jgi:hypothetical protein